jgi:hypothetical protein
MGLVVKVDVTAKEHTLDVLLDAIEEAEKKQKTEV